MSFDNEIVDHGSHPRRAPRSPPRDGALSIRADSARQGDRAILDIDADVFDFAIRMPLHRASDLCADVLRCDMATHFDAVADAAHAAHVADRSCDDVGLVSPVHRARQRDPPFFDLNLYRIVRQADCPVHDIVYGTGNVGKAKEIALSAVSLALHIGKRARKGKALESRIKVTGLRAQV